ncbi:MAG: MATE family efflux transporter [Candidatus Omnitrophica bacterium]|nr:MATE family efflux transporter [Candidatus Omnitrophota bacterium]
MRRINTDRLINGSISKSIFVLTLPLLVRAMLQSTQTIIDIFWVGKLGPASIAAVAMAATVIMAFFPALIGIGTGAAAMVSRAIGAKNQQAADNAATQSIIIAFLTALFLCIVGLIFSKPLLVLLQAKAEVLTEGHLYLKIIFLGGITTTLLFLGSAILQGAGDTLVPMCIMGFCVLANIVLDPILIFGLFGIPKLGVSGAALATIIADALGAIILLHILFKGRSHIHIRFDKFKINPAVMWEIMKIGIPSSVQMFFRNLMGMLLMGITASFGTCAVAAYGIGMRLRMIILLPAFSFGTAAATLVGQNMGAKKPLRAQKCAWQAALINAFIMTFVGILFFLFSDNIIGLFNSNQEVIAAGGHYLRITSLFFPAIAFGVVLGRSMSGAGDTITPMVITIFCLCGIQIPLAIGLSRFSNQGLSGIWWAIAAASLIQGILAIIWFKAGRWKKRIVNF